MSENKNQIISRIILSVFTFIFIGMFAAINYNFQSQVIEIRKSKQTTEGFIIEKQCRNHHTVKYSYVIGGHEYSGAGASCTLIPCDDSKIGDSILVYYSAFNPKLSRCGDLGKIEAAAMSRYVILFCVFIGLLFWIFRVTK